MSDQIDQHEIDYPCGHRVSFPAADGVGYAMQREIERLIPLTEHGECSQCQDKRLRAMLNEPRKEVPPMNNDTQTTTPRCACGKPSEISTDDPSGFIEQCRACYDKTFTTPPKCATCEKTRVELGDDLRLIQAVAHKHEDAVMILVMEKLIKKYAPICAEAKLLP